jgi:hypothetical protein
MIFLSLRGAGCARLMRIPSALNHLLTSLLFALTLIKLINKQDWEAITFMPHHGGCHQKNQRNSKRNNGIQDHFFQLCAPRSLLRQSDVRSGRHGRP